MSYGVTKQGFVRKTYEVLFDEFSTRAKELFGPNINLSVFGVYGLLVRLFAWAFSLLWQDHEKTFYQLWIDEAEGEQLDFLVAFAGITRFGKSKAIIDLEITGEAGTPVDKGFIGQTAQKIKFVTLNNVIIGDGGTVLAKAEAQTAGVSGNVAAESVTDIFTPVVGVDSITNPAAAVPGREVESDEELRARYKISRALAAGSSIPALTALMRQVTGNIEAKVYENDGVAFDADGRPPGCVEAVVYGGIIEDYANALFGKKAAGVKAFGQQNHVVVDSNGQQRNIGVTFATERQIYVRLVVTKNDEWNEGNTASLKTAAVQYIGGIDTIDTTSTSYTGLGIGETTYTWKLIAGFNNIKGIKKVVAFVGFSAPANRPDELAVGIREKPRTSTANVTVEFTN